MDSDSTVANSESSAAGFGVLCPRCRYTFTYPAHTDLLENSCAICRAKTEYHFYPRYFRDPEEEGTRSALSHKGDATCVFYPELKAEKICDECGSFLSSKAAVDWSGSTYCMPCLYHLREKKRETDFQAKSVLHENRALGLMIFLLPFSLFTAPLALFLLLKNRKVRGGFVPRTGIRWWLALVLSITLTTAWIVFLVIFISLMVRDLS